MKTFSQPLVETCIEYFHRKCGVDISDDTANEYLRSFARLYLAFARDDGDGHRPSTCVLDVDTPTLEIAVKDSSLTRITHIRGVKSNEVVSLDSMHKVIVSTE